MVQTNTPREVELVVQLADAIRDLKTIADMKLGYGAIRGLDLAQQRAFERVTTLALKFETEV